MINFNRISIFKNYPLNDTEKLKYSYLLEILAKNCVQSNDNETGAKHLIKSNTYKP